MQTWPVLQSVSYMQAKAGAEQRQSIVAMIRLRMEVPSKPPKNHTAKCPNLDRPLLVETAFTPSEDNRLVGGQSLE
jgi:hypothetical protein